MATAVKVMEKIPMPLGDRVILRAVQQPGVTPGGILLPDVAKGRPLKGEVLAVGPGAPALHTGTFVEPPAELKKGAIVYFPAYGGNELSIGGDKYLVLRFDELLAIEA